MATGDNGALLGLSGPRNPYPAKLGDIEEGALADLLWSTPSAGGQSDCKSDQEFCRNHEGRPVVKNLVPTRASL
jgi:hypothetical protein